MKSISILLSSIFFILLLTFVPNVYAVNAAVATPSAKFVDDEIVVKLKPSAPTSDINPLAQAISGEVVKELLIKNRFLLKVPKGSVEKVIKTLLGMPQVATATPNFIAQKQSVTNDPSLEKEWGLFQIQAASSSTKSAWDITSGKTEVKIAVLDTGIEKIHPDLEGKIIAEKNFSNSTEVGDIDGHGTLVAGIIAAVGNNSSGIAGVAYSTSLMNGKVLNDDGMGTYANIAEGIVWATDNGAKVINLSFGGSTDSDLLQEAVDYAYNKGVVLVAPVGNAGTNTILYPANYSNVLSVSATDDSDSKLNISNYGPSAKVAAPGDKIYSTYKNNSYAYATGTSMASAFTSGLAALIVSTNICVTNTCVLDRIENTSDQIAGTGTYWKFGRINALQALSDSRVEATSSASDTPTPFTTAITTTDPIIVPAPINSEPPKFPTSTIKPNIITASNIEMWTSSQSSHTDIFIRVTISKQSDNSKVMGALVTIDLTSPDGTIFTGSSLTNIRGQATFALRSIADKGVYKTQITSVKLNSYIYNPTKTNTQITIH